jgi:hypothetical protein
MERAERRYRTLRYAAILYFAGTTVHAVDHFRRGLDSITNHVNYAGTAITILAYVAMALIFLNHRLAPVFAVAVAFPHALGIAAVHLLPRWGVFSDAFTGSAVGRGITGMSWAAVLLEIAGALATGFAAADVLRREPLPVGSDSPA